MSDNDKSKLETLRQKAEARLLGNALESIEDLSLDDLKALVHDYRVHQIELELQNEELRTAQAEIESGRARYFDLYDLAPVGYVTVSEKGLILEANLTAATLLGVSRAALVRQPISRFILKEDQDISYLHRKKLFETGEQRECELRMMKPDGSVFWVHLTGTDTQSEDGGIVCRLVLSDISDRKRAEEALRNSDYEKTLILDNANEIIAFHDTERRLVWANNTYLRGISGVSGMLPALEDMKGKKCYEAWGLNLHCRDCPVALAIKTGVPQQGELTPHNQEHWPKTQGSWTINAAPVKDAEGVVIGAIEIAQDITDRKKAEDKIKAINEQLQLANTEKDKLFTIIAHDLKSPMCGLVSSTEMLANEPELFSEKDIRTFTIELHKNAKNTFALLEDLLQWARMSQGGMDYAPTSYSLGELVNMGLSTAQDLARKKEISLRLDIAPGLAVLVDQPMIKTVIRNILFNAIKFTPSQGEIVITARLADRKVTMSIQDNGMGMNGQVLSSIFTLEKEKCRLGTDGEKGTGLGLVLCKQFIEQHGGKIWVESEVGKGTTVFFTLPVSD